MSEYIDNILNIELGAGCGNFGNIYYKDCIESDYDYDIALRCNKDFINIFCDAKKIPFKDNRFDNVIMCNPYGYGFDKEDNSLQLFLEIYRVLKDKGCLIIVGNYRNKYCSYERIIRHLHEYNSNIEIKFEEIDNSYYNKYIFNSSDGKPIYINFRIKIYVKK